MRQTEKYTFMKRCQKLGIQIYEHTKKRKGVEFFVGYSIKIANKEIRRTNFDTLHKDALPLIEDYEKSAPCL